MHYKELITFYKDFPKKGINFADIVPLASEREAYNEVTRELAGIISSPNLAAVEARGFFFAPGLLLTESSVQAFIPIRKEGKLPHTEDDIVRIAITKEYGEDILEFRLSDIIRGVADGDVFEISILDDALATGGTVLGIAQAINARTVTVGGKVFRLHVKEFVFLVELEKLGGREKLESIAPVHSLIKF